MEAGRKRDERSTPLILRKAKLRGARIAGAFADGVRLEAATLNEAQMEGTDFSGVGMQGAFLNNARIAGGDLRKADLRSAEWAGAQTASPAHSADLRGGNGLTQSQLDRMIGNTETLLPETLEDGTVQSIPACWAAPPTFFESMIARLSLGREDRANELRAEFLCPEGAEPARTGTPLALDAPYPGGHPLADRAD